MWYLAIWFLVLLAGVADAKETEKAHLLTACPAQTDIASTAGGCGYSDPLDAGSAESGSFQVNWTNITTATTPAATLVVEVSNDDINWATKSGATVNVTASGSGVSIISLNQTVTEKFYRVHWEPANTVSAGAVDVYAVLKGSNQ